MCLNGYALTLSGEVRLFRVAGALADRTRSALEDEWKVAVFGDGDDAVVYEVPDDLDAEAATEPLAPLSLRGTFAVREALLAHCRGLGLEARGGRMGELRVGGLPGAVSEDIFRIEPELRLRVAREHYVDAHAVLTVRQRRLWRCEGSLAEPHVADRAVGAHAVRLAGNGPARGRVLALGEGRLVLADRNDSVVVDPAAYTLAVNSALVASWRGSDVLRRLRIRAGELTQTGKRNRHAVADRFRAAGEHLHRLGSQIEVAGGGKVDIGAAIELRLEEAP